MTPIRSLEYECLRQRAVGIAPAHTDPIERALRISARVNTGTMAINGFGCQICAPFGGVKPRGLGREMGPESAQA
jgi:acyl-CoA reductase-like NAD-dependent aldehyde dehydrogenase